VITHHTLLIWISFLSFTVQIFGKLLAQNWE
jgi:hypothetical protein